MLGPFDYFVWILGFALEVFVVFFSLARRQFLRYLTLNLYMLAAAMVTVGQFYLVTHFGLYSLLYRYFYYYTDALLTILLYFSVFSLYQHVFKEMAASRYVRGASLMVLGGTALVSFLIVRESQSHLTSRFVVQLSQNLYFVGLVLIYILWGAVMKLRETRTRVIQLVLALGIYFSAYSATYALRNLFPDLSVARTILPPLVGTWLPFAWACTLWRVPEEARLATARLAATHAR
ncbi:MAG TPA: hypothetical protein VLW54_15190 [Candidatus Acidoferrales bacterium]|nr:hypothetical protein [Candidatus Acidoferrales bacterium]